MTTTTTLVRSAVARRRRAATSVRFLVGFPARIAWVLMLAGCGTTIRAAEMGVNATLRSADEPVPSGSAPPVRANVARLKAHVRLEPQVFVRGGTIQVGNDGPASRAGNARFTSGSPSDSPTWTAATDGRLYPTARRVVDVRPYKIDRVFRRMKPRYETDAEKRGYSWVLAGHVTPTASVYDERVVTRGGVNVSHWKAVRNATWFQPYGRGSSVSKQQINQPVVHVSYRDAFAFCSWARKRLPTEDEWEFAARGGVNGTKYPWGSVYRQKRTNLWQGAFPTENKRTDGYDGISPVDAFPIQNDFGLYDMLGNVWEWTSTVFTVPLETRDRNRPRYTLKGGSFVDAEDDVTISIRLGLFPEYTGENVGFRCVERADADHVTNRRVPVRHRLTETWDYKVKKAVNAIVGSVRKSNVKVADEL